MNNKYGLTALWSKIKARVRQRYLEHLLRALQSTNAYERASAANSLGGMRDPVTIDALVVALYDAEARVREQSARALLRIGVTDKVKFHNVVERILSDQDVEVRSATIALDSIQNQAGLKTVEPLLVAALERETSSEVRYYIATCLVRIKNDLAYKYIFDDIAQLAAEGAMTEMEYHFTKDISAGGVWSVQYLIGALASPDENIRMVACSALGMIGEPSVVEQLLTLLDDPSIFVQDRCLEAIKALNAVTTEKVFYS